MCLGSVSVLFFYWNISVLIVPGQWGRLEEDWLGFGWFWSWLGGSCAVVRRANKGRMGDCGRCLPRFTWLHYRRHHEGLRDNSVPFWPWRGRNILLVLLLLLLLLLMLPLLLLHLPGEEESALSEAQEAEPSQPWSRASHGLAAILLDMVIGSRWFLW